MLPAPTDHGPPRLECPLWSHDGELLLYPARSQPESLCEPAVAQPCNASFESLCEPAGTQLSNGSILTDPGPPLVPPAPPDKLDGTLRTTQDRINLLAHAGLCSHKDGRCTIPHCVNLGRFRQHIENCIAPHCRVPHCMVYRDPCKKSLVIGVEAKCQTKCAIVLTRSRDSVTSGHHELSR